MSSCQLYKRYFVSMYLINQNLLEHTLCDFAELFLHFRHSIAPTSTLLRISQLPLVLWCMMVSTRTRLVWNILTLTLPLAIVLFGCPNGLLLLFKEETPGQLLIQVGLRMLYTQQSKPYDQISKIMSMFRKSVYWCIMLMGYVVWIAHAKQHIRSSFLISIN